MFYDFGYANVVVSYHNLLSESDMSLLELDNAVFHLKMRNYILMVQWLTQNYFCAVFIIFSARCVYLILHKINNYYIWLFWKLRMVSNTSSNRFYMLMMFTDWHAKKSVIILVILCYSICYIIGVIGNSSIKIWLSMSLTKKIHFLLSKNWRLKLNESFSSQKVTSSFHAKSQ